SKASRYLVSRNSKSLTLLSQRFSVSCKSLIFDITSSFVANPHSCGLSRMVWAPALYDSPRIYQGSVKLTLFPLAYSVASCSSLSLISCVIISNYKVNQLLSRDRLSRFRRRLFWPLTPLSYLLIHQLAFFVQKAFPPCLLKRVRTILPQNQS